eukprot:CAMPEP_0184363996 /NCGR_PEP_ID=MMETSP1089-20130417/142278_1 /TAXON_ID=38269 ORGANISM="Gloeochaete wittrockiana, Strain SAG46.84" /NCGR_SAMPLE_ID=MMETSP1089 /ASSEMBLY_ACC=CAM_ASM_000445 /LENGTH=76 /DNA_ID=CAMNT_0026704721 /DNA_START=105 /DNA_END=335 /DNA_ORIENTATION=-
MGAWECVFVVFGRKTTEHFEDHGEDVGEEDAEVGELGSAGEVDEVNETDFLHMCRGVAKQHAQQNKVELATVTEVR